MSNCYGRWCTCTFTRMQYLINGLGILIFKRLTRRWGIRYHPRNRRNFSELQPFLLHTKEFSSLLVMYSSYYLRPSRELNSNRNRCSANTLGETRWNRGSKQAQMLRDRGKLTNCQPTVKLHKIELNLIGALVEQAERRIKLSWMSAEMFLKVYYIHMLIMENETSREKRHTFELANKRIKKKPWTR